MSRDANRLVDYFVVCGLGPELRSAEGPKGYHGTSAIYIPALLDQYPPASVSSSEVPPLPPQIELCVMPMGVSLYSTGLSASDESSFPRSYPIVLTAGDGSKCYVSCVAFRDPIEDDVAEAYGIPANYYADKCICIVSRAPCFQVFRDTLEELHRSCFSSSGCSKAIWDIVKYICTDIPLPTPGRSLVLFAVEGSLLSVEIAPNIGLPHASMSFQPLVQSLDVDNIIFLFTAILLERRVLMRANKLSLLTMVAEAVCHLLFPMKWQHVYIPVLPCGEGVNYIGAPTPYLMGLHSSVDTSGEIMDGVVVVDLDKNRILSPEVVPEIPEPEIDSLRAGLLQLICPSLAYLDRAHRSRTYSDEETSRLGFKPWGQDHDRELRLIFLKFFANVLSGYRDFVVRDFVGSPSSLSANVFNTKAFLKKRTRTTNRPVEPMLEEFLSSQGFANFLARGDERAQEGMNIVDTVQDAIANGQNILYLLSGDVTDMEILTVSESASQGSVTRARHCYDRFPTNLRSPKQEEERQALLAAAGANFGVAAQPALSSPVDMPRMEVVKERVAEREIMVLDIKTKLLGLWRRLLMSESDDDPLLSSEYGTLLALIESDAEGIGGCGFVECIREHINSGWNGNVSGEQFIAVKELMKTTVSRATSRNDLSTVQDCLNLSSKIYWKENGSVPDYVERHLGVLPVWDELRFWEGYFETIMDKSADKSGNYAALVMEQLTVLAQHMAGLGLPDAEAWYMLEVIALKNNLRAKQLIKLRGLLALVKQINQSYWGQLPGRPQLSSFHTLEARKPEREPEPGEQVDDTQVSEAAGRSWVSSMFARDKPTLSKSVSKHARSQSEVPIREGQAAVQNFKSARQKIPDVPAPPPKRGSSGVRLLKGHKASVTALYAGTADEKGDNSKGDFDDARFFISGSADCLVKIWDPRSRGNELRATFIGHTGAVRAISADRVRVVSGSDDLRVLVWDKATVKLLEELKGHDSKVSSVRMLSGERVLTSSHDGTVKMWDVRTHNSVATVARDTSAVLCMDYDDSTGVLVAAGTQGEVHVSDVRAGKLRHRLTGHTNWIRSLRLVGDTIITGSDDWTARVWSVSQGSCDAVLACHAGSITCVEHSAVNSGIITGSADGTVRIWERHDGELLCVKVLGVHSSTILAVKAGEKCLAVGAADNSLSLCHRATNAMSSSSMAEWQLLRTSPRSAALVRSVAADVERGRVCTGARNGFIRLWEPLGG